MGVRTSGRERKKAGAENGFKTLSKEQKKRIRKWFKEETKSYYLVNGSYPDEWQLSGIVHSVHEKVREAKIPLSYAQLLRYYKDRQSRINKKVRKKISGERGRKTFNEKTRSETVSFTNMCMICDSRGNIVALDKVGDGYTGTTFPGGHVEEGETFYEAVIREVKEETGLTIQNPQFCGVYHWKKKEIHHVLFLYRASEYAGILRGSKEGQVYWIPLAKYRQKELAGGMEEVLEIMTGTAKECCARWEEDHYEGYLY